MEGGGDDRAFEFGRREVDIFSNRRNVSRFSEGVIANESGKVCNFAEGGMDGFDEELVGV